MPSEAMITIMYAGMLDNVVVSFACSYEMNRRVPCSSIQILSFPKKFDPAIYVICKQFLTCFVEYFCPFCTCVSPNTDLLTPGNA